MTSRANRKKRYRLGLDPDMADAPAYLRPLDPTVRGYCTAYVDILGTAKALRDLDDAMDCHNSEAIADIVKRTAGSILFFRMSFADYYKEFSRQLATDKDLAARVPPAGARAAHQYKCPVKFYMHAFSDGIAVSVRIDNENRLATFRAIYGMLHSIAGAGLALALGRGQLVRGGVAAGYGCTINGNEVLGAGLAKAAAKDSRGAPPRVAIDSSLMGLLQAAEPKDADQAVSSLCALLRARCLEILEKDGDTYYANFVANDLLEVVRGHSDAKNPLDEMAAKCAGARDRAILGEADVSAQDGIRGKYDWFLARIREAQSKSLRNNCG